MSRHITNCRCSWCKPPETIRRLLGKVFGYPECCVDAFENESSDFSAKDRVRNELFDLKNRSGLESLAVFIPCRECAAPMLKACKTYKKRGKRGIIKAFKKFMTRPFSYDHMPEGPYDETFQNAAVLKLNGAEYVEMYNYFEDNPPESDSEEPESDSEESECDSGEPDTFSYCWVTRYSGVQVKRYSVYPKYCIPCN